jgi:hypothetical protein
LNKSEVYASLNRGVLSERLMAFSRNLTKNRALITDQGGLASVVRFFSGVHVVIVGAGESLDRSIPLLKKVHQRDDVVLLAVDMALGALYENGIVPDFAITCETSPRDFFSPYDTSRTTLLAFSCSSNSNLRSWRGPVAFYNWLIREEPYESLWKRAGLDLGFVATGSTVTTQALSIIMALPSLSITVMGNDLAFANYPYCRGVSWYKSVLPVINRFVPAETAARNSIRRARHFDIKRDDKTYCTNNQFLGAKYWIEDLLSVSKRKVCDMSEPGVSGKYISKISSKQFETLIFGERANRKRRRR